MSQDSPKNNSQSFGVAAAAAQTTPTQASPNSALTLTGTKQIDPAGHRALGWSLSNNPITNTFNAGADALSHNPQNISNDFGTIFTGGLSGDTDWQNLTSGFRNNTPNPTEPPPPPTLAQANQVALQGELSQEQKMHASATILNYGGSSGLIDQPTTASRTLLGS